jgi:pimeloyl-ACP methyl ester carboxylesterase
MFEEAAPLLATTRPVVVPDRIGFGHSDPPRQALTIADYATSTLDLLDALAIERFDVIGMHTGSCEAVELASAQPGRVRRAGVVGIPAVAAHEVDGFKQACIPPELDVDGTHLGWFWKLWTQVVRCAGSPERPSTAARRGKRAVAHAGPAYRRAELELAHDWTVQHLASVDAWKTFHAAFDYPIVERICTLSAPFLVIAARDEIWDLTQRALPLLPTSVQVLELPDVESDALFTTATATLTAEIARFLDQSNESRIDR